MKTPAWLQVVYALVFPAIYVFLVYVGLPWMESDDKLALELLADWRIQTMLLMLYFGAAGVINLMLLMEERKLPVTTLVSKWIIGLALTGLAMYAGLFRMVPTGCYAFTAQSVWGDRELFLSPFGTTEAAYVEREGRTLASIRSVDGKWHTVWIYWAVQNPDALPTLFARVNDTPCDNHYYRFADCISAEAEKIPNGALPEQTLSELRLFVSNSLNASYNSGGVSVRVADG